MLARYHWGNMFVFFWDLCELTLLKVKHIVGFKVKEILHCVLSKGGAIHAYMLTFAAIHS